MKFGFIGAGNVAQAYARHFVWHGHEVVLSNAEDRTRWTRLH